MNTRLIAKYLLALRKQNHFTQEDLAKELQVSRQAVSKWETGNTIPDLATLLTLSQLYHVSINTILEPDIPANTIENFEQIVEIPEIECKNILSHFTVNDIVTASLGASPTVNDFLSKLFPDIDFKQKQAEMGRIKVTTIEAIQNQITAMINLDRSE